MHLNVYVCLVYVHPSEIFVFGCESISVLCQCKHSYILNISSVASVKTKLTFNQMMRDIAFKICPGWLINKCFVFSPYEFMVLKIEILYA